MMRDATLCYLIKNGMVLLQKKAQGKFGEGKWNAPGGKIEKGETPEEAAIREVMEETGLKVKSLSRAGILKFREHKKEFYVYVFVSEDFSGTLKESEEGKLRWFDISKLPYEEMWEDDRIWLPYVLKRERFVGSFLFSKGFEKMLEHKIRKI